MTTNVPVLELSHRFADAGISVIPIATDGTKRPFSKRLPKNDEGKPTWKPFQNEIAGPDELRQMFSGNHIGIAMVNGRVSGNLETIDFDDLPSFETWQHLIIEQGGQALLEKLINIRTPRPGQQLQYRCDDGIEGNQPLARRLVNGKPEVLVETRGEGGYNLAPGCPPACHKTKRIYELKRGDIFNPPVITARERTLLLNTARSLNEYIEPSAMHKPTFPTNGDGLRPGDDYNARATWQEILGSAGWALLFEKNGVGYWGSAEEQSVGATTNFGGSDLFYVFTTAAPHFEPRHSYSKFAAFTNIHHVGDYHAAARALADAGYGKRSNSTTSATEQPITPTTEEVEREEREAIRKENYSSPCPPDHYLTRWLDYAGRRTDAAPEYHEAGALVLLASATPNVRARLAPYPKGLSTNLYALMIGDSTISRKSTSESFARDAQGCAIRGSLCADHFSPEGFVEQLASRPSDCTTLYVDEFGELLAKIHHAKHMAGLRGLLLTIYSGESYTYRRHSKRVKGGEKIEDVDHIEKPHLSILGATTPAIFDMLVEEDIISGLLPRFGIIMPDHKPPRRPFYQTASDVDAMRDDLIAWISRLHQWATCHEPPRVQFDDGVLARIDEYSANIESDCSKPQLKESARAMLQRLTAMTVKLAMLVAAGHPDVPNGSPALHVNLADADAGIVIAQRWQGDALRFAARIGESNFERVVQRCLRILKVKGHARRGDIARVAHVEAKILDGVRDTLEDRELVIVEKPKTGGRIGEIWRRTGAATRKQ